MSGTPLALASLRGQIHHQTYYPSSVIDLGLSVRVQTLVLPKIQNISVAGPNIPVPKGEPPSASQPSNGLLVTGPKVVSSDVKNEPYVGCFAVDSGCKEDLEGKIRSPLQGGFVLRSCLAGFALLKHCKIYVNKLSSEVVLAVLTECLSEKELEKLSCKPLEKDFLLRQALSNLCEDRVWGLNQSGPLANILIKHLPLEVVAQAKVEADYACIFMKLAEKVSLGYALNLGKGASLSQQIPTIKQKMQTADLSMVEELDLSKTCIETISTQFVLKLTGLKKLNFSNNHANLSGILTVLQKFSSLEELNLSDNCFTQIPDSFFEELKGLKKLKLLNNNFSSEEKTAIQKQCVSRDIKIKPST